jgi:hypothetical protein
MIATSTQETCATLRHEAEIRSTTDGTEMFVGLKRA